MAYHFSANQYEKPYSSVRLNNWELPRWHPPRPRQLKCCAKVIADSDGYLLPGVKRDKNPWGNFRSTYMLPDRLTRRFADEYHECLSNRHKWRHFPQKAPNKICHQGTKIPPATAKPPSCPTKCEAAEYALSFLPDTEKFINKCEKRKKCLDLEYIPGDLTPFEQQHPSRKLLLEQKYKRDNNNIDAELPMENLHLGEHQCKLASSNLGHMEAAYPDLMQPTQDFSLPLPSPKVLTPPITPPLHLMTPFLRNSKNDKRIHFTAQGSVTGKPNERCPSPITPVYDNFELAKRMHHDNLEHQPLPDCVPDSAYCQLQLTGAGSDQVLGSQDLIATGMGVKSQNIGPTQCSKLKVYRPKTCAAAAPTIQSNNKNNSAVCRPFSSRLPTKKVGAMDLAIYWDYAPATCSDEPTPPQHIDGSNDSAGPAVFNYVKTPRDDADHIQTGRSAGVFDHTLGQTDFFDKDTTKRATDFTGRPIERNLLSYDCEITDPPPARALSASRNYSASCLPNKHSKLYQSSPDLLKPQEIKTLREKYLGSKSSAIAGCKRANPGFLRSTRPRLCQKVTPEALDCCVRSENRVHIPCRAAAFRVGVPRYNAAGVLINPNGCCSAQPLARCHSNRVLVIPRPRSPYLKKNYNIETLVPPFLSHAGGSGQGGYPEQWRLSSVYQHAFKPLEQRKRPLLQTVYK